jgi:hypothetical protein
MLHRFAILTLFTLFFVASSANDVQACGGANHAPVAQQSCCDAAKPVTDSHCAANTDDCAQSHPGTSCPDEDGCGGCHCPGCGMIATPCGAIMCIIPEVMPLPGSSQDVQKRAFYFAEHLPEAVYLPIWQPPQLV